MHRVFPETGTDPGNYTAWCHTAKPVMLIRWSSAASFCFFFHPPIFYRHWFCTKGCSGRANHSWFGMRAGFHPGPVSGSLDLHTERQQPHSHTHTKKSKSLFAAPFMSKNTLATRVRFPAFRGNYVLRGEIKTPLGDTWIKQRQNKDAARETFSTHTGVNLSPPFYLHLAQTCGSIRRKQLVSPLTSKVKLRSATLSSCKEPSWRIWFASRRCKPRWWKDDSTAVGYMPQRLSLSLPLRWRRDGAELLFQHRIKDYL